MKLITEAVEEVETLITESDAGGNSDYYISGLFSTFNKKNNNGRVYPRDVVIDEYTKYAQKIKENDICALMEYDHPARANVDIMEAVAKVVDIKIDGDNVYGKAKLLDNPKANQLKTLIDNGIKLGVSSRALGSKKFDGTVTKYKLITFDIVSNPSNFGSYLSKTKDGSILNEGVLEDKNFEIMSDGSIEEVAMCNEGVCEMYDPETVRKAIKEKFKTTLKKL